MKYEQSTTHFLLPLLTSVMSIRFGRNLFLGGFLLLPQVYCGLKTDEFCNVEWEFNFRLPFTFFLLGIMSRFS